MNRARQAAVLAGLVLVFAVVQFGSGPDPIPPSAPIDVPAPGEVPDEVLLAVPSGPGTWTAEVAWIADGDTFTVHVLTPPTDSPLREGDQVTVRLLRIDTPEHERDDQPLECWANEATNALETLTPPGSRVTLQYDDERQDRFGRDLAHVWNESGTWVNGQLLLDGHARYVTFRPNVAHDDRVRALEQIAIQRGAGLWGECLR